MSVSQADRLPKIKRIELSAKQMRPPEGSKAVGSMPDGTVIWEGPVFAGNPWFKDHANPQEAKDNGHVRVPVLDIETGKQKYRRNKATGEAITAVWKNKRRDKIVRFVMSDDGNGSAGPRPVPGMTAEEKTHREHEANRSQYEREFFAAAQAEGIPASELVKTLAALGATGGEAEKRKPGRPKKNAEPEVAA